MSFWNWTAETPEKNQKQQTELLQEVNNVVKGVVLEAFQENQSNPRITSCPKLCSILCTILNYGLKEPNTFEDVLVSLAAIFPEWEGITNEEFVIHGLNTGTLLQSLRRVAENSRLFWAYYHSSAILTDKELFSTLENIIIQLNSISFKIKPPEYSDFVYYPSDDDDQLDISSEHTRLKQVEDDTFSSSSSETDHLLEQLQKQANQNENETKNETQNVPQPIDDDFISDDDSDTPVFNFSATENTGSEVHNDKNSAQNETSTKKESENHVNDCVPNNDNELQNKDDTETQQLDDNNKSQKNIEKTEINQEQEIKEENDMDENISSQNNQSSYQKSLNDSNSAIENHEQLINNGNEVLKSFNIEDDDTFPETPATDPMNKRNEETQTQNQDNIEIEENKENDIKHAEEAQSNVSRFNLPPSDDTLTDNSEIEQELNAENSNIYENNQIAEENNTTVENTLSSIEEEVNDKFNNQSKDQDNITENNLEKPLENKEHNNNNNNNNNNNVSQENVSDIQNNPSKEDICSINDNQVKNKATSNEQKVETENTRHLIKEDKNTENSIQDDHEITTETISENKSNVNSNLNNGSTQQQNNELGEICEPVEEEEDLLGEMDNLIYENESTDTEDDSGPAVSSINSSESGQYNLSESVIERSISSETEKVLSTVKTLITLCDKLNIPEEQIDNIKDIRSELKLRYFYIDRLRKKKESLASFSRSFSRSSLVYGSELGSSAPSSNVPFSQGSTNYNNYSKIDKDFGFSLDDEHFSSYSSSSVSSSNRNIQPGSTSSQISLPRNSNSQTQKTKNFSNNRSIKRQSQNNSTNEYNAKGNKPRKESKKEIQQTKTSGRHLKLLLESQEILPRDKQMQIQEKKCAGCEKSFRKGLFSGKPRRCRYTGQLYCSHCHHNQENIIPSKIIDEWDFQKRKVCDLANDFLNQTWNIPCICVSGVNPQLFHSQPVLMKIRNLRQQMVLAFDILSDCPNKSKIEMKPKYMHHMSDTEMFSLNDLVQLSTEKSQKQFVAKLEHMLQKIVIHVTQECSHCEAKGKSFCPACEQSDPIYQFEIEKVSQCPNCKSVFHAECYSSGYCQVCLRRRQEKQEQQKQQEQENQS